MEVNNAGKAPESSLIKEVENAITAAQNRVTTLTNEAERLERLNAGVVREIAEREAYKEHIGKQCAELEERKSALEARITTLNEESAAKRKDVEQASEEHKKLLTDNQTERDAIAAERKQIAAEHKALDDKKETAANRERSIEIEEKEVNRKKAILTDALSKL